MSTNAQQYVQLDAPALTDFTHTYIQCILVFIQFSYLKNLPIDF